MKVIAMAEAVIKGTPSALLRRIAFPIGVIGLGFEIIGRCTFKVAEQLDEAANKLENY